MDIEKGSSSESTNLYTLEPEISSPVSQALLQKLKLQANAFHQYQQSHNKKDFFSYEYYYIISKKWLQRWKVYVSYQQTISNKSPSKFTGVGELPIINENIVEKNNFTIKFEEEYNHYNVQLKPNLVQQKDYIFATSEMWEIFYQYDQIPIKRYTQNTTDGKIIQLYYTKITLVAIFNQFLKDVEKSRAKLVEYTYQISSNSTVKQMEQLVKQYIISKIEIHYYLHFSQKIPAKFWLLPSDTTKSIFMNTLLAGCRANPTYSYKMYIQGQLMLNNDRIKQYDIMNSSIIVIELKQDKQNWCFFNEKYLLQGSCNYCKDDSILKYLCACKYAAYCSRECKQRDKYSHKSRCPFQAQSQQQTELVQTEKSRKGLVGLRNLGNTCFMNSGIQCLSHILQLTKYFLSNNYQQEINRENPLGTRGQLSTSYAKVLKCLWYGSQQSVSPNQLKRAIAKFQPMFSGYNQHDAGELVTYLLDGLHQDLNRVKKKPYVQSKQYDGRPDFQIAKQAWQQHLARNRSQIVDLMYGQYRSVIDCPKCTFHSIVFNPFLMCQLPIKVSTKKEIEIHLVKNHFYIEKYKFSYDKKSKWKLNDFKQDVKKKLGLSNQSELIFYISSYSSCELLEMDRDLNEVRKQYGYRRIFCRELLPDQKPQTHIKVKLSNTKCSKGYYQDSYHRNLAINRFYFIDPELSCQQVHHKLYKYYQRAFPSQDYYQDFIKVDVKQQPMRILMIPASRYSTCAHCLKKNCQGCLLPYDKTKKFKQIANKDDVQMEIFWRKNVQNIEKMFEQTQVTISEEIKQKAQVTLFDCFKLFQEPQILTEDNQWYCPKCKDFVCAQIQMQIYKAPKILILNLKRFKRKQNHYYQQKNSVLVQFPVNNFDIRQYIINPNLPEQYFDQSMNGNEENKMIYDLFGIINHFGSTSGGHYTAYCKNDGEWYDFDDNYVTKIQQEKIVSQNAYVLFYRKRQ